ncbi:DNA primase small subunit-like [Dysidea avara]|uniref:DNA primase small subunit-like n=1 Tax=Dysidea avara TaxID=196820 RepID=UPI0033299D98
MEESDEHAYDKAQYPILLKQYYMRLFPYEKYYQWLSYSEVEKGRYFTHREFSFTIEGDIYIRYQSFQDRKEFEEALKTQNPHKIDIGAIYNIKVANRKKVPAANFKPLEKELVFDLDMTDYDDVRNCCSGASICLLCWKYMIIAIKVVDRALRDDFGFRHVLWVYSGRRGVHCWVCDLEARRLGQEARSAIVEYLTLVSGGEHQKKKVNLKRPFHPLISYSLEIIEKYFNDLVKDQEYLSTPERWSKMLALLPGDIRNNLDKEFAESQQDSLHRWGRICAECYKVSQKKKIDVDHNDIMIQFAYPRLDINVSKGLNHLLKSPFCVHPKTGRVCVPIDIDKADNFNPFEAPTISLLRSQVDEVYQASEDEASQASSAKNPRKVAESTSLKPALDTFSKFVKQLSISNNAIKRENADKSLEF